MAAAVHFIQDPRHLAVACALEVERNGLLVSEAMSGIRFKLSDENLALTHELVYGSFRYLPGLNRWLGDLCKPAKLPPKVRWLLLISLYQLKFLRTPAYAVLNEANRLAAQLKFPGLKGLVNGVLRSADRGLAEGQPVYTDQEWLLPEWLLAVLVAGYGPEVVQGWLSDWKERTCLSYWTVSGQPIEPEDAAGQTPHAWRRTKPIPYEAFTNHRLYVQNESSQAIGELACRVGGKSVLDLCAAPGGKSCYIDVFGGFERLVANDIAAERVARLRENRDRLGRTFEITMREAASPEHGLFDLVLVDAPCTGLGIIGRHPEIKFLKKGGADETLRETQARLLEEAWALVQPGGHLLYTVCSLDSREVPEAPVGAERVVLTAGEGLLAGLPIQTTDAGFFVTPTAQFDGFRGCLLHKPR